MPTVSVIIVNYNAGDYLKRCVEALLKQSYRDFEVFIADNGSTDHSLDNLPNDARIHILKLKENLGFAVANNRAAAQATGEWLALLNPDAFAKEDWLEQLLDAAKRHPTFSMFGSTQINADNPALLDGTGDIYHILGIPLRGNYQQPLANLRETGEVFAPCAAAALYKKEVFQRVGGFDEQFFCYCEDVDLAFRLRLQGERCLQVKEAVVHHIGSGITGKASDFARYYGVRNRFWVFYKNMPTPIFIPLLPLHLLVQCALFLMTAKNGQGRVFIKAWQDVFRQLPYLLRARKEVQSSRSASVLDLCRVFTFSLRVLWRRAH